jgi:hypothetical protein
MVSMVVQSPEVDNIRMLASEIDKRRGRYLNGVEVHSVLYSRWYQLAGL